MHDIMPEADPGRGRLTSNEGRAILVGTREKEQVDELESLADTFGLTTVQKIIVPLRAIDARTYIGKGKVEEIQQLAKEAEIVIFDDELSPQQQRNLEKAIAKPVIDRSELILGIFAARAQSREARIQVELAAAKYQLPRLKGLWMGLNRQRSGSGGKGGAALKGEGEKRLEIDRRILQRRIDQLQAELEEVKKHRETQRRARLRSGIPTFAIIGYTNVGKSTLLNRLTEAEVLVEDKLFATLDTTTRKYILPNKQEILLIDTVGFIRKLPHLLVAAFKSTLEEAVQADILLHLIDVSNPQAAQQAVATMDVLKELNAEKKPIITVLNKVDVCEKRGNVRWTYPKTVEISAKTGEGIDLLLERMISEISLLRKVVHLRVPQSHYALVSEIMKGGKVISMDYEENDILMEVEIPRSLERKVALFEVS